MTERNFTSLSGWINELRLLGEHHSSMPNWTREAIKTIVIGLGTHHSAAPTYKCFHCKEQFTDPEAARLHFGDSEYQRAICTIDAEHFRWMEAQHRRNVDDDSEALRTVRTLANEHERLRREAEELGYARGLRDAKKYPAELGLTNALWLPIETAPKDGTKILGLCVHEADPYSEDGMLTPYAARYEGMAHVANGPHVIVWDEAYEENDGPESQSHIIPGWWTLASDNEVAANPTHYVLLPGALE